MQKNLTCPKCFETNKFGITLIDGMLLLHCDHAHEQLTGDMFVYTLDGVDEMDLKSFETGSKITRA